MPNVVFVAPFFMETTLHFVQAAASLGGVRLGLVSQDPEEKLPPGLREQLAGHYRVTHGLDSGEILQGVRALGSVLGSVDRLLGTLEELQVPLAEIRETLGIRGMGPETARNFRDKARMKTVLREAGVPCARHRLVHDLDAAWGFAREVGYPLIVKPPEGSGARGTFRIDTTEAFDECLRAMTPSARNPTLLEEFITGEEHSFDSLAIDGRIVWHSINQYFPSALEVLRHPWIQWCVLTPRDVESPRFDVIRSTATRALDALGMETGLSHLEWFLRKDGSVAVSEVGARPPGAQFTRLASYADDFDLYEAWARVMVFGEFTPVSRGYAAGIAFLRGQGRGRVQAVRGLEEAQKEVSGLVAEVKLPKMGQTPSGTYEGEGYVILRHPETMVVADGLQRIIRRIRVELG